MAAPAHYTTASVEALQIAAVVACVGLRAGALAQLPIKAYRDADGIPSMVPTQPELLSKPSNTVVPSIWKTQMSISRDIWGFALGAITAVDGAGYPSRVEWLSPDSVSARLIGVGQLDWRVGGQPVDAASLLHVPSRWVLPGNPLGVSPLEYSGLVDIAKRAQDFGRDWFRNGAVPSSIIYSDDKNMTGEQADGIVAIVTSKWRARKPAVLGSGLRYEQISVAANESQFLETCRQAAHDIAISFNLPPEKIGAAISGGSITYANRDQNQSQYLIDSINPDLVVVQEVLDQNLNGAYARFNTGAFLRSDLKTRYESYAIGVDNGFLDVDEVRAWEELPPMSAADASARDVAEVIQKIYLGVGVLLTADEARTIANRSGAGLDGPMPTTTPDTLGGATP
jgi:HK97 family phage portal protein